MELPAPNKETWWYDEYATMAEEHRKEMEILKKEEEFRMEVSKARMAAAMTAASGVSYDPNFPIIQDNTMAISSTTSVTEDMALKKASKNLLQCHSNMSLDVIQNTGDEYKTQIKIDMMDTMRQEIMNKTKFTMIQDPTNVRMNFKAQVYVFTENELKEFINSIINS